MSSRRSIDTRSSVADGRRLGAVVAAAVGVPLVFLGLGSAVEQPMLGLLSGLTALGVIGLACALLGIPRTARPAAVTDMQGRRGVQNSRR